MKNFDADLTHPWATRWRIPRVTTSHPGWRYEVALVVPTPGDTIKRDGDLVEPTEAEAEIVASLIEKRCAYYDERWRAKMLEQPLDVDDLTNTVVLAKTSAGWRYRLDSHRHGLWPFFNMPEKQAEFPPTAAGLVALLDHICWDKSWQSWMADHPRIEQSTLDRVEAIREVERWYRDARAEEVADAAKPPHLRSEAPPESVTLGVVLRILAGIYIEPPEEAEKP